MPKLSTAQRKELPADQFGLPEDRAFPMPDESHVRSAIAYFHTCPPKKKKELAANINRLAKQYGMKVKLKKYSAFKPYADKDIIAAESSTIDYLEAPTITMEEKHVIKVDLNNENLSFDTYHKMIQRQYTDPIHSHHSCQFSDRLNDAINQAIKKSAQNYLDKEYILNGRFNTTRISDYIYDTDLKLCYDITRNFFYTKSVYDANMLEKIRRVANKDMLINAFNEIKKHIDAPIITKMCDDIDYVIRQSKPPEDAEQWGLLGDFDWRMKDEVLNPRDWATNGINLNNMNDFGFLARPSNFRNFSEEEIQQFLSNHKMVSNLCGMALYNMVTNFGFPPMKDGIHISHDVVEMDRRGIIDGYYICGDNDDIDRGDEFKVAVKMKDVIYVPVHIYRDEEKSIITMVKMFDNDIHKHYFLHISDIFLRSREKRLPKMPVRRVTFYRTKATLEQALEGISVSPTGEINLVNT